MTLERVGAVDDADSVDRVGGADNEVGNVAVDD